MICILLKHFCKLQGKITRLLVGQCLGSFKCSAQVLCSQSKMLNDHLFGKELFVRFTASAFRKLPSIYIFSYFPFGFEGRIWDLIVSVPDHCLSFYFDYVT